MKIEDLVNEKDIFLSLQETEFFKSISDSETYILENILNYLQKFSIKGGKFQRNEISTKLILQQLNKVIVQILETTPYRSEVGKLLHVVDKIGEMQKNIISVANGLDLKDFDITTEKKLATDEIIDGLLNKEMLRVNLGNPLKKIVYQNVTSGITFKDAEKQLKEFILGSNSDGTIMRYAKIIAREAISGYEGMINQKCMVEFNMKAFSIVGSLIKTSQPVCIDMIKETGKFAGMAINHKYSVEDIPKILSIIRVEPGFNKSTTASNYFVKRNHWGCRHTFIPTDFTEKELEKLNPKEDVIENNLPELFPVNFDKRSNRIDKLFDSLTSDDSGNANFTKDEWFKFMFGGEDKAEEKLRNIVNESGVYMAINRSTLEKVLKSGKFMNSLETGKGTFKTIGEERAIKEKLIFGLVDEKDYDSFPKYGFLSDKNEMNYEGITGWGYGETYIKFKKENLINRTSFTIGDSYDGNRFDSNNNSVKVAPATKLNNPKSNVFYRELMPHKDYKELSAYEFRKNKLSSVNNIDDLAKSTSTYVEAQIYGKLGVDDIAEVYTSSINEAEKLKKLFKNYPNVKIKALKFDARLKHIVSQDYSDIGSQYMTSFSTHDIDNLGDYYIDKLAGRWLETADSHLKAKDYKIGQIPEFDNLAKIIIPKTHIKKIESQASPGTFYNKTTFDLTISEKRKFLKELAEMFAKKDPIIKWNKFLYRDYKPTLLNWTDDVINTELLKKGI